MANLASAPAIRQFLPGSFEDAFVYMNTLVVVTTDREILTTRFDRLIHRSAIGRDSQLLAGLFLLRNDFLEEEGTRSMLKDSLLSESLARRVSQTEEALLDLDEWEGRLGYEDLLGEGTLLDLQIYNQRLFAGTTHGVVQTNLLFELDDLRFSAPIKRTDARCLSLNIRYGTLAASCGPDGLLMSFDEFSELSNEPLSSLAVASTTPSVRTSWLGYHIVNYESATSVSGFRSKYRPTKSSRKANIVTEISADEGLLGAESEPADSDVDFRYNAHTTFFSHFSSGLFELRRRRWSHGRLGQIEFQSFGEMSRPLSTHSILHGFVAETYDAVVQVEREAVYVLYSGEAIVVRSFPYSQWYRNLILVVAEDGLHIMSPLRTALTD